MNGNLEVREIVDEIMKKYGFRHHYEVADYFGITAQTLSGWLKNNSIPHKHLINIQNDINNSKLDPKEVEENYSTKIIQLLNKKGKRILLLSLIGAILSFGYFNFFAMPIYTAKASVIPVGDNGSDLTGLTGAAAQIGLSLPVNNQSTIAWDELFFEILRSNGIRRKLLKEDFFIKDSKNPQNLAVILIDQLKMQNKTVNKQNLIINKFLKDRIRISKTRFSPLINIEIDTFQPKLASDMITRLIKISNEMQVDIKTRQMGQKRIFISERIKEVQVDLALAEGRV